ncbi:MAG: aldehyde dehydrogenase family protein, partial [Actinophytocola sp.]|nr:aldehyde dehydrogenase family protein [Actinophytocola sp.]
MLKVPNCIRGRRSVELQPLLIDGAWVDTAEHDIVVNPYDGREVGRVARATAEDARLAVEAAVAAHRRGAASQHERAAVLDRVRDALVADAEAFAQLIAAEAGKPIRTARAEVQRAADTLRFSAVEALSLAGVEVPFDASALGVGKIGFTRLRPRGVVTAITPFNFPLNLVCHKVAPAVAAGCPVVLKPAEDTPLTAYALAGC